MQSTAAATMLRMTQTYKSLTRRFYRRGPEALARSLLGRYLVRRSGRECLVGRIVEVEAYLGEADRAAHCYGGRHTNRNHSMYLDGGHAYVYFTYGMHHCVNVVSDRVGVPTACLIRALEPVEGVDQMRANRAGKVTPDRLQLTDLCSGPAKLTQALRLDRTLDGYDLTAGDELSVCGTRSISPKKIVAVPRIGIDYAGEWVDRLLRFCVANSPHLSVRPPKTVASRRKSR
jgi:DNA-3-methyladenine glycosylase